VEDIQSYSKSRININKYHCEEKESNKEVPIRSFKPVTYAITPTLTLMLATSRSVVQSFVRKPTRESLSCPSCLTLFMAKLTNDMIVHSFSAQQ
jgi:hypothetical protein